MNVGLPWIYSFTYLQIALIGDTNDPLVPSTLFRTVRCLPIKSSELDACNIKINISPLNQLLSLYVKDSQPLELSSPDKLSYITMKLPIIVAKHFLPHLFETTPHKLRKVIN